MLGTTPPAPRLTVYIGGAGRSGSTLLDLLLGAHPAVQSLGEVHRLNSYARDEHDPCTCGLRVLECPFWLDVERHLIEEVGPPPPGTTWLETREIMLQPGNLSRPVNALQKGLLLVAGERAYHAVMPRLAPGQYRAMQHTLQWYEAIRKATGCPVLVDSTKDARRLKMLYLADPEPYRLVYMVRDGRAVAASKIRRTGVPMTAAAHEWVSLQRKAQWAQRTIPSDKVARLRYEDLCRDPGAEIQRLCAFLGLSFDPGMLRLDKQSSHNIGGNPMRFRKGELTIELDERWRTDLSAAELAEFERIAGGWNSSLGYSSPSSSSQKPT
jgi:hypothetical protein